MCTRTDRQTHRHSKACRSEQTMYTRTSQHTPTHTYIYTHTYIHTYIHTYTAQRIRLQSTHAITQSHTRIRAYNTPTTMHDRPLGKVQAHLNDIHDALTRFTEPSKAPPLYRASRVFKRHRRLENNMIWGLGHAVGQDMSLASCVPLTQLPAQHYAE